jgi:hypothetical protein
MPEQNLFAVRIYSDILGNTEVDEMISRRGFFGLFGGGMVMK